MPDWLKEIVGNPLLLVIVLLLLGTVVMFVLTFFSPSSPKSTRGGTTDRTAGLVTPELDFPVVVRLLELDAEQKPTGKVLGYSIRPNPGPREPVFLFLNGEWKKLGPIQSLHHLQIRKIQEQIRDGIRKELPPGEVKVLEGKKPFLKGEKPFEQITPPGHFVLNGETWRLDEAISFAGELVRGQLFSFKGGKGLFELMWASFAQSPEEGSVLVLEKTVDEFRRAINETWMCYSVFPTFYDEIAGLVDEDILASLDLAVQSA